MNFYDYVILAGLFILALVAVLYIHRKRKKDGGCTGDCSSCAGCGVTGGNKSGRGRQE